MNPAEVRAALHEILSALGEQVVCAYLFGSHARGEASAASDVDVAILFRESPPATLDGLRFDLAGAMEARLRRPVDLVVLNHAPADLVHRILRDGRIVAEHDRFARIRFEVKARNEYFDLAPVRARYRAGAGGHSA
ncbi:MAG: nucleotidyltransferase domain-containing protein [Burkholderiales bacterium]|nr:nucleotidyltransferase domain-containing protein [Burkholderiales bacterium]